MMAKTQKLRRSLEGEASQEVKKSLLERLIAIRTRLKHLVKPKAGSFLGGFRLNGQKTAIEKNRKVVL
jgi:hypothetical protein